MFFLEKISSFTGRYMAIIVLVVASAALVFPGCFLWIKTSWITTLLMIVMFGMGLSLKASDFLLLVKRPKEICIGFVAQYSIMPLLAYCLGKLFCLDDTLLVGLILVGTCPGGTASNVMTYLARGDLPLSIGMTCASTLLAPLLTPFLTWLFLREVIAVDAFAMILAIGQVVILPIGLGFVVSHFFSGFTKRVVSVLSLISVTAIVMIVAAVVAANAARILSTGLLIFAVVVLHNGLGYLLGYLLSRILQMPLAARKAVALEVGMQNSGLAVSLAATSFPSLAMATVPGALFSVWHNISGALLAGYFRRVRSDSM